MKASQRAFWLRQLHQWHWISAALSLVGMLVFAVTGVTLNHAADIPATPQVTTLEGEVPQTLLATLPEAGGETLPLPDDLRAWLGTEMDLEVGPRPAEWSADEIYLALPRPGGDAWLSIDLVTGGVLYEATFRGWVSYFNDLHKGRDTGTAWRWFIDIFAGACVIFCVTGLILLQFHAARRPSTWPMVGFGFIAPLLLVILFIH
ncbi:PepSY-associated TM helix domain-containing protein [Hyphococcus luteus]|uniref:Peptidase n=1 Tax=Hyphococcus luteus TaxID=2058213 RepID=A0A2S7K207_9PROT|nr:PepSY-associated TM helix domain-containing protein [Marinicaulis flavus]PQA86468.1 hypothetical protein CW354_19260 [Marinicaulis flavus]